MSLIVLLHSKPALDGRCLGEHTGKHDKPKDTHARQTDHEPGHEAENATQPRPKKTQASGQKEPGACDSAPLHHDHPVLVPYRPARLFLPGATAGAAESAPNLAAQLAPQVSIGAAPFLVHAANLIDLEYVAERLAASLADQVTPDGIVGLG
jgi:hypothetical protein